MSVANSLWLINIILAVLTLVMARNVLGTRGRRARDKRGHFLTEAVQILERSPKLDDIKEAWHVILRRTDEIDSGDTLVSAICALEKAEDVDVDALRSIIVRHVNLINQVGEFVDQGLVRPKDIARLHPRGHLNLLYQLALIAPFIWYESILQGRGRWGYRPLRLKTIFEQLRPISSRQAVRSPLVLEIAGLFFLALPSVTLIERAWSFVGLSIRSPSISARSKVTQTKDRNKLEARLRQAGLNVRRSTPPRTAVDW